jgi:Flp pilus assembly protein TadG
MSRSDPRGCAIWRDRRGAVVVEAAIMLPLLALSVVAFVDVARYMQTTARADRAAGTVADLVSRAESIRDRPAFDAQSRNTDTGVFFAMAQAVAEPDDLSKGAMVIASITGGGGGARVNWSVSTGAAATEPAEKASVARFEAIALPDGMPFVAVEVSLPFDPVVLDRADLLGVVGFDSMIRRSAVYRPRSAALTEQPKP